LKANNAAVNCRMQAPAITYNMLLTRLSGEKAPHRDSPASPVASYGIVTVLKVTEFG
jgi:hypothetical protein